MGIIKQSLSGHNIKVKKRTSLHQGFCPIDLYELEQQRFDGSWTPAYTREFVKRYDAVGALTIRP